SAAYKGSGSPRMLGYYRNANGGWIWWAQSNLLTPASDWTTTNWTTPALPSDATAFSVGLSLYAPGNLTMDAFKVTDGDTIPPNVSLIGPGDAATVGGPVMMQADVSDEGGIARVE